MQDIDRGWNLSFEERQKARKEREEQIEQDRRDFDRLFRFSINRRAARASSNFSTYVIFISDHLRVSRPVDGDGLTRIYRDAVRDGRLIPAIDRAWRGSRRVSRQYAPQSWPKRAPDPKPTIFGVRNGQYLPLNADGSFADDSPYVPVPAAAAAATIAGAGALLGGRRSESGSDLLGAAGTIAGAAFGGAASSVDDDGNSMLRSFSDTDDSNSGLSLGDAQPFEYAPGTPDGDAIDVAGLPSLSGDPNSWVESGPGMKKQWRMFGPDGSAAVDIDFDSHHGQPNPHAHNWDGTSRDQGWPVSIFPR
ncbi:hypothetical protein [Caballeronia sp. Lep1P3]|uniref:hypothetical protein n=1 Tax=Caballeronia sp. Lep1P3 TaxID=2878150 RepID=UPI001FD1D3AC|nr:hypothetical protein [Caballeronia sp. Lep1P3]